VWNESLDERLKEYAIRAKRDWKKVARKFVTKHQILGTTNFYKTRYELLSGQKIIKRVGFTREEDLKIAELYVLHKTEWDEYTPFFETRNRTMIKNRFYSNIRDNLHQLLKELVETGKVEPENIPVDIYLRNSIASEEGSEDRA
jgi:hypothetical protein